MINVPFPIPPFITKQMTYALDFLTVLTLLSACYFMSFQLVWKCKNHLNAPQKVFFMNAPKTYFRLCGYLSTVMLAEKFIDIFGGMWSRFVRKWNEKNKRAKTNQLVLRLLISSIYWNFTCFLTDIFTCKLFTTSQDTSNLKNWLIVDFFCSFCGVVNCRYWIDSKHLRKKIFWIE